MKPACIVQLEQQTEKELQCMEPPQELVNTIRYEHNGCYVMEGDNLIALNLTENDALGSLRVDGASCSTLRFLNLGNNKTFSKVHFDGPLSALEYLDLSGCSLERFTLPAGCNKLSKVWLQDNGLKKMSFSGPCPQLMLLDLSKNKLHDLTLPYGFLELQHFYLVNSGVKELHVEDGAGSVSNSETMSPLPKIQTLHLAENNLKKVPENVIFSPELTALYLGGNRPKNIPWIFLGDHNTYGTANKLKEVRIWFEELRSGKSERNQDVKLMLLGNSNVGKTTLVHSLEHGSCERGYDTTHSVEIKNIPKDAVTYSVWDFGGQEVYHTTHRLFLSDEALQVIVFDRETEVKARNDEEEPDRADPTLMNRHLPIQYWHETTKELSPNSRFFLVQNCKEGEEEGRDDDASRYAHENKFEFVSLDAKKGGKKLRRLLNRLEEQVEELSAYGMEMPPAWLSVRRFFSENIKKDKPIRKITQNDYQSLCDGNGLVDNTKFLGEGHFDGSVNDKARDLLFSYLHHGGYLYYRKELAEDIIVDQRWALDAIYALHDRELPHYKLFGRLEGQVLVSEVFSIFGKSYGPDEKWLLLDFMRSCELCFPLNDRPWRTEPDEKDLYILPEFLPEEKPLSVEFFWQRTDLKVLRLRYCMSWLNYQKVKTFITALGRKTPPENFWRYGIHIITGDGCFKVELNRAEKQLQLAIEERAVDKYLSQILDQLDMKDSDSWEILGKNGLYGPLNNDVVMERHYNEQKLLDEKRMGQDGSVELTEELVDVEQNPRKIILFLGADPEPGDSPLSLENEHSHIERVVKQGNEQRKYEVQPEFGVSFERVVEGVRFWKPEIIHFAAHGIEDDTTGGGIVLHGTGGVGRDDISMQQIVALFTEIMKKSDHHLKVVFFNVCHSASIAREVSKYGLYCLGTNSKVNSKEARLCSAGFYKEYGEGGISEAFEAGIITAIGADVRALEMFKIFYNGQEISRN